MFWRVILYLVIPILFATLHVPYPSSHDLLWETNTTRNGPHRFLLLTAHPDDECMFFGPTLVHLLASKANEVHSMCLSSGNADGLGETRVKELGRSLDVFGVNIEKRVVLGDMCVYLYYINEKQYREVDCLARFFLCAVLKIV